MSAYAAVQQLRLLLEFGVRGIYLCGGLNMNGADNWYPWGLGGPGYYAFFKGMHDPDVNPSAVRFEFIAIGSPPSGTRSRWSNAP